jgi:hypothetical protein
VEVINVVVLKELTEFLEELFAVELVGSEQPLVPIVSVLGHRLLDLEIDGRTIIFVPPIIQIAFLVEIQTTMGAGELGLPVDGATIPQSGEETSREQDFINPNLLGVLIMLNFQSGIVIADIIEARDFQHPVPLGVKDTEASFTRIEPQMILMGELRNIIVENFATELLVQQFDDFFNRLHLTSLTFCG